MYKYIYNVKKDLYFKEMLLLIFLFVSKKNTVLTKKVKQHVYFNH